MGKNNSFDIMEIVMALKVKLSGFKTVMDINFPISIFLR